MCGGDGRIGNAFGATKSCPGCGGSGRRQEDYGQRDVTKTKSVVGRGPAAKGVEKPADDAKRTTPMSFEGMKLANEIKACASFSDETKDRLFREVLAHEASHGTCTMTFAKKLRKQIRAVSAGT